jgi:hypothetical protein
MPGFISSRRSSLKASGTLERGSGRDREAEGEEDVSFEAGAVIV